MAFEMRRGLTPELAHAAQEILGYAKSYGLDFWEICFELLDFDEINEVAAYGGFPTRYPHWKFGMEYEQLAKGYEWGLSKIYELVINNDPCYAYLMKSNSMVDQKLVMAHVCGHADFFKNNFWFAKTNRKMMDQMANHGTRMRRYAERYGHENVEAFIDACLSIDNLIDIHSPFIKRRRERNPDDEDAKPVPHKLRSKEYMDRYINPPEFLEEQQRRLEETIERTKDFPEQPERDVLLFLLEHARLERWQRDILGMVRDEAYYFAPQAQTKIMNEGWACLVPDSLVFTEAGLIPMRDLVAGQATTVCDGETSRAVYDQHIIPDHETVKLTTRRGLILEGSTNHRVLLADGETWRRLDELTPGDRIAVSGGRGLWAQEPASAPTGGAVATLAPPALRRSAARRLAATATEIPSVVLRSPEPVVREFLHGLVDRATASAGVLTFTLTRRLAEQVQLVLLNYGLLSTRRGAELCVAGASLTRLAERLGVDPRLWQATSALAEAERWDDEVVSLERGRSDVYDISVEETHRYVAQGVINHNSYWHSTLMTEKILDDTEVIDYADRHAGTMGGGGKSLNPYKLGIELFRDIEDRWNTGKFGPEWDQCDDQAARRNWDKQLGLGREKIFEVRRIYNDVLFVDEFLTEDFARQQKLFTFEHSKQTGDYVIASREFQEIKSKLLDQLTNWGNPFIYVTSGNHENRGELYLKHEHHGQDLRVDHAKDTLENVQKIWGRPVHLESTWEKRAKVMTYNGRKHSERSLS